MSDRRFRFPWWAAVLLVAGGCAAPRPAPRLPEEGERVSPPTIPILPSRGLGDEVRARLRDGESGSAREILEVAEREGRGAPALRRLLAGEILESEGDVDGALVRFYRVEGAEGGRELAASAWDAIARVRGATGRPSREVARARLLAWERSGEAERRERDDDLDATLAALEESDLRMLVRDPELAAGRERVRAALDRRYPDGRPGRTVAALVPLSGRFERFGRSFLVGARIALRDRDLRHDPTERSAAVSSPPSDVLAFAVPPEDRTPRTIILGAEEFRRGVAATVDSVAPDSIAPDPDPDADADAAPAPDAEADSTPTWSFDWFADADAGAAPEPRKFAAESPRAVPVRLVVHDTGGDALQATRAARLAIREDGADAVVGPLRSITSIAAGGVAQAHGVPLIAPTATDPEIGEIGSYVLPLDPDPVELAGSLARFAVEILGERRFGVLMPRDGQSSAFEQAFRDAVVWAGGEVALSIAFDPEESDFRRLLDRLVDARVDAVYIPGGPSSLESLAPQLDFYDFPHRILGHGGWTNLRLLDPGNLALEGALFSVETADDPDSEFRRHLREEVWRDSREEVSRFHVSGYRAMAALLLAVDEGARGGEEIVETLRRRSAWPVRSEGEGVRVLTFRDGVLGPASWAAGFDLVPKLPPEPPEEDDDPDALRIDHPAAIADSLRLENLDLDADESAPFGG